MKKLLFFWLFAVCFLAKSATITGPISDLSGGNFNPRVEFWPLSTPLNIGVTNVAGTPVVVPAVSGNFSKVLLPGRYLVKLPPSTNSFIIHVPNDTGTYSLAQVSTNVSSVTGIANAPVFRVKATSADTNAGFLSSKLVAGSGITITTNNAGQSETLTIASSGTSGALTNNETRDVNFNNMDVFNVPGGFSFSDDGLNFGLEQVIDSSGLVADAHIASTITRDAEMVAADTVVSNGIVTGLAAGSYVVNGALTNGSSITNITSWIDSSYKEPYWTWQTFGEGPNFYLRDYQGTQILRVRRDLTITNNNAIYFGDPSGGGVYKGLSFWLQGIQDGNPDPRITFVFTGAQTNSTGTEVARDTSWQFRENKFGADYIDPDSYNHVSIDLMIHDYTNTVYVGWTNRTVNMIGSNLVIQGTLKPTAGIIGDRTITSFSASANTRYTNGDYRAHFHCTIGLDPSGGDASTKIVTYKQNNTGTNFWADISVDDPASEFLVPRYGVVAPLNPNEVFYIQSSGSGGPPVITNAKIVAE